MTACLKHFLRIIWISNLMIGVAHSKNQEIIDMSLEELLDVKVITATKREIEAIKIASIVTILTHEELLKGGAENLADGLRFASGVNIRKSPGSIPQYNSAIRGNVSDFMNMRTLFLMDGVPVRNINGGFDPGWIPLSIVKRVEIVKGPNSNLWGANAFGGVINIITMKGSDINGLGNATIGYQLRHDHVEDENRDGNSIEVNVGKKAGKLDYLASVQNIKANDSTENYTGHQYRDIFARVSYEVNEKVSLSLRGLLSLDENQVALDISETPIENNFTHIAGSADIKIDADSTLKFTPYINTFDHNVKYTNELKKYENQAASMGLNSQYTTTVSDVHAMVGGFDIVTENGLLSSNSFDYSTFPPAVDKVGWNRQYQTTWGAYYQYEYLGWEKFHPTAGIRYDKNSLFGSAISPRLSLSYLINKNFNVYTSAGRGFRAPVFNETHINGYGKIGDKHLNPEFITTYEIGFKNVHARSQNSLAIFHQSINDKITLEIIDPNDPNSLQTYRNIGASQMLGMELDGSYNILPNLRTFYNTTLLRPSHNNEVERLIKTKFVLGLDCSWETWNLRIMGIQEGEQFYYNTNNDIPDDSQNRFFIPKQTTGDIELAKKIGKLASARVYVNNFTNLKYRQAFSSFEEQNGTILPGRKIGLMFGTQF